MIEFLKQYEKRGIKITPVNSIFIAKSINLLLFTLISYCVGVRCNRSRFSVLSPFIEKSMVLHTYIYFTYTYFLSPPPI